jgi:hypothetical protein
MTGGRHPGSSQACAQSTFSKKPGLESTAALYG